MSHSHIDRMFKAKKIQIHAKRDQGHTKPKVIDSDIPDRHEIETISANEERNQLRRAIADKSKKPKKIDMIEEGAVRPESETKSGDDEIVMVRADDRHAVKVSDSEAKEHIKLIDDLLSSEELKLQDFMARVHALPVLPLDKDYLMTPTNLKGLSLLEAIIENQTLKTEEKLVLFKELIAGEHVYYKNLLFAIDIIREISRLHNAEWNTFVFSVYLAQLRKDPFTSSAVNVKELIESGYCSAGQLVELVDFLQSKKSSTLGVLYIKIWMEKNCHTIQMTADVLIKLISFLQTKKDSALLQKLVENWITKNPSVSPDELVKLMAFFKEPQLAIPYLKARMKHVGISVTEFAAVNSYLIQIDQHEIRFQLAKEWIRSCKNSQQLIAIANHDELFMYGGDSRKQMFLRDLLDFQMLEIELEKNVHRGSQEAKEQKAHDPIAIALRSHRVPRFCLPSKTRVHEEIYADMTKGKNVTRKIEAERVKLETQERLFQEEEKLHKAEKMQAERKQPYRPAA